MLSVALGSILRPREMNIFLFIIQLELCLLVNSET